MRRRWFGYFLVFLACLSAIVGGLFGEAVKGEIGGSPPPTPSPPTPEQGVEEEFLMKAASGVAKLPAFELEGFLWNIREEIFPLFDEESLRESLSPVFAEYELELLFEGELYELSQILKEMGKDKAFYFLQTLWNGMDDKSPLAHIIVDFLPKLEKYIYELKL